MGQSRPMTPQQYVQQKAAASGSSFYYAFLFLPAPRRAAITAASAPAAMEQATPTSPWQPTSAPESEAFSL